MARVSLPSLLILLVSATAHAKPGWLEYANGDRLAGELVEATEAGGRFRSARFGELSFDAGEARFSADTPIEEPATIAASRRPAWLPDSWSITGAAEYEDRDGSREDKYDLDLAAEWHRDRDDVELGFQSDYTDRDGEVTENDQRGRLRWFRQLTPRWFVTAQAFAERDQLGIGLAEDLDYLLLQGTVGGGIRWQWSPAAFTRFGVAFNRFSLELLDLDVRAWTSANSAFADSEFRFSERVSLANWIIVYDWETGDTGIDAETELSFAVSRYFDVGLRHRYRDRGATLESIRVDNLKFFTRLRF